MESVLTSPYFLGFFGATVGFGLLVLGVTYFLFRFLRKRIAEDIMGMPAPGGPDDLRLLSPAKCPWPCQEHKSVVDRLYELNVELDVIEIRQKSLREETLPERYVARRDYDGCKASREKHEDELFRRVGTLERKGFTRDGSP